MKVLIQAKKAINEGGLPLLFEKIWRKLRTSYLYYFAPAHQMPKGLPSVRVEFTITTPAKDDVLIAKRILAAFQKASKDEGEHANLHKSDKDSWDNIGNQYHADFYRILFANDAYQVADRLRNMHSDKLTFGISGGSTEYNDLISSARLRSEKGVIVKDILVSFAETLGILPYETNVPYMAKKNIYADSDWLVDEIEKKIGISIIPPEIDGGLFKLRLKKGLFDMRDLWSLYAAWRISRIIKTKSRVCEIGAGLGKSALYADRFGFRDYAIFDLPIINAVQAWYLIKALPKRAIVLYGEKRDEKDSIKIMPYWKFMEGTDFYELVLNEDSFPEIDREVVDKYLQKMKERARYFLSINQEFGAPAFAGASQNHQIVPHRVETSGGYKRIHRFPFWLRKGYVEELYEIP